VREWLLGDDTPGDLLRLLSLFAVFLIADRLTRRFASLSQDGLFSPVLIQEAVAENLVPVVLILVVFGALAALFRTRLVCRWDALDHGTVLRAIGAAVVLWLAWRTSAYDFNYVLDQWHIFDRVLVAALAFGAVSRPVFLLPFVAQVRVVNGQFSYPLGTAFGQVFDELLLLGLLVLGAAYLLRAVTGRRDSTPVLLIWSTIVAAHLFEPGRAKLMMGWLQSNDVSLLTYNSYTAGWTGQGTGQYVQSLGALVSAVGWPVKVATLVLELGAIVAVLHPRVLCVWLPMAAIFHALTFAMTGFFFFDWLAFELCLLVVLTMPSLRGWVMTNATPARTAIAVIAVALGARLYHAPSLAWFDAPVAYGYEVEATGASGREYHVPLSAFAPFEQEMAFTQANFSPVRQAVGGYGATNARQILGELETLVDIADLASIEATLEPLSPYPDPRSEQLATSFFRHVTNEAGMRSHVLSAPSRFWSGRPEPSFRNDERIDVLRITLVASLTVDGSQQFRRTPVLTITRGAAGEPTVERLPTRLGR
jgi:hypothetical protein